MMDTKNLETRQRRREGRQAWQKLCADIEPNVVVHLVTNDFGTVLRMRSLIRDFSARIDSWALGTTWSREPSNHRMSGAFFVQHVNSNIHAHGLVRLPFPNLLGFQLKAEEIWARLCPSGSIMTESIYFAAGIIEYCTKEIEFRGHQQEQIILLSEFMSSPSLSGRPTKQR